jgi:hypothetical protein
VTEWRQIHSLTLVATTEPTSQRVGDNALHQQSRAEQKKGRQKPHSLTLAAAYEWPSEPTGGTPVPPVATHRHGMGVSPMSPVMHPDACSGHIH